MAGFDHNSFAREVEQFRNGVGPYIQFHKVVDQDCSAAIVDVPVFEGEANSMQILAKTIDSSGNVIASNLAQEIFVRINSKDAPPVCMSGVTDANAGTFNLIAGVITRVFLTVKTPAVGRVLLLFTTGMSFGSANGGPNGGGSVANQGGRFA